MIHFTIESAAGPGTFILLGSVFLVIQLATSLLFAASRRNNK